MTNRSKITARLVALGLLLGSLSAGTTSSAQSNGNECLHAADCDDGLWCTGTEACVLIGDPGDFAFWACVPQAVPDCDDGIECTVDSCHEPSQSCRNSPPDVDGDGHGDASCTDEYDEPLGDDCDDDDSSRFPGNVETCDSDDEDCDPDTVGTRDADGDGVVSAACCNGASGCGGDCDDSRDDVAPFHIDVCDGFDNDCSGVVDDGEICQPCGGRVTLYPDLDRDGFGDPSGAMSGCANDTRYSSRPGDCDDSNPSIVPGAQICGGAGAVRVCSAAGTWTNRACLGAFERCATQADGTGACFL